MRELGDRHLKRLYPCAWEQQFNNWTPLKGYMFYFDDQGTTGILSEFKLNLRRTNLITYVVD